MKFVNKGLLISVCCMLLVAGCSSTTNETTVSDVSTEARITEQETTEVQETEASTEVQETEVSDESVDQSSEIASIKIVDISDGLFEDEFEYFLTPEQVSEFAEIQNDLSANKGSQISRGWCKLELYGKDDELIDTFVVDLFRNITDSSGQSYNSEKLTDWLKSLDETDGISFSTVWGRVPSESYYKLMSEASFGKLDKRRETNFDEKYELELDETDIKELSDVLENVEFSKEATTDISVLYTIDIYTSHGASLYYLYVDEDVHIYTEFGYEITGGTIKDWVEERIE